PQSCLDAGERQPRQRQCRAARCRFAPRRLRSVPRPHELHGVLPEGSGADLCHRRPQAGHGPSRLRRARREASGAEVTRLNAALFAAQRASAAILAVAVTVHLATIIYAVRGGVTAAEILGRTRHNGWFLALYLVFVVAVAIHAPIGLRNI